MILINFPCDCGAQRAPAAEMRVDGPDGEVVTFTANADACCIGCGKTLRELADQEGEG
jgi:hypothetical protein